MRKILGFLILILLLIQCGRIEKDSTKILEPEIVSVEKEIVFDTLFLEKCYNKGHYGSIHKQKERVTEGKSFFVQQEFIVDSSEILKFDTIIEKGNIITKRHFRSFNGYTDIKVYSEDETLIFKKRFKPLERRIKNRIINKIYQDFFFSNRYKLEYINLIDNCLIFSSFGANEYCVCDTIGNLKHVGILPFLSSNINEFIDSHNLYITSSEIYDVKNSSVFSFVNLTNKTLLRYYLLGNNIYLIFEGNEFEDEMNDIYVLSNDLTVQKKSQIKIIDSRSEIIDGLYGGKKVAIFSHLTDSLLIIENKFPFNMDWFSIDSIKLFEKDFTYHDNVYFNCSSPLKNLSLYVDTLKYEFRKEFHERDGD